MLGAVPSCDPVQSQTKAGLEIARLRIRHSDDSTSNSDSCSTLYFSHRETTCSLTMDSETFRKAAAASIDESTSSAVPDSLRANAVSQLSSTT